MTESASTPSSKRYSAVAIVLHWAIAAAILLMIPLGWWMSDEAAAGNPSGAIYNAFQLHKSIGLTVLALSLARLGWRLANPPPPMPPHMPAWERTIAKATHWAFYGLMIGLPLSGWVFVSAGWSLHDNASMAVPTHYFGTFQVPALFGLTRAAEDVRAAVAAASMRAHSLMAWAAIVLVALHIGAALKHHLFDKDNVLTHMIPGLRALDGSAPPPRNPQRLAVLGVGLGLTGVALAAALFAISGYVAAASAPQHQSNIEISEPAAQENAAIADEAPDAAALEPVAAAPAGPPANPSAPAAPAAWRVDAGASAINFTYVYADESGETPMTGRFTRWRADIRFDPDNLAASRANVTIETASVSTNAAYHTSTLPSAAWFNSAAAPNATFVTREITARGNGYAARGDLTIRGVTRPVTLPFTLTIEGDRATMAGTLAIARADFGVGAGAEGDDMIGPEVTIQVRVIAARAP